jgi:hypothetical protein
MDGHVMVVAGSATSHLARASKRKEWMVLERSFSKESAIGRATDDGSTHEIDWFMGICNMSMVSSR